jgi:hypothetical protein
MGRVGAAGDNAAMESFFALLQNDVLDRRTWSTRDELRTADRHLDRTHLPPRRRQAALGRLTPIEYEAIMTPPASQAAWLQLSPIGAADPWRRSSCRRPESSSVGAAETQRCPKGGHVAVSPPAGKGRLDRSDGPDVRPAGSRRTVTVR